MSPLLLLLSLLITTAACAELTLIPGAGYEFAAYDSLRGHLAQRADTSTSSAEACVAHSADGSAALLALAAGAPGRCGAGLVVLGAVPSDEELAAVRGRRVLVVAGTRDGVARLSHFAAGLHRSQRRGDAAMHRFAVVPGASHHSFAGGEPTALTASLDLRPAAEAHDVHATVAGLVAEFLRADVAAVAAGPGSVLAEGERLAAGVAAPIVAALKLEGSAALGVGVCNSDFPTNPSCNYPKYPDFSLGPRQPAPSPLPAADCICGSPWVTEYASPTMAGVSMLPPNRLTVTTADAFHDVSDTRPFHLPHIWNACPSGSTTCSLNITSLTMPVPKAGALFPNASSAPLSVFELRTKLKSRQVTWESAGLGKQSGDVDKKNLTICRDVNQAAYDWALAHADATIKAQFLAHGTPFVMTDDKEAPIGLTGPTWIKSELVYNRTSSAVEIQSWQFVVGESPVKTKYLPTGMHYCKLLSPARAMEWIYTDSLRDQLSL